MTKDLKIKISIDKKTGQLKVVNSEFEKMSSSIQKAKQASSKFSSSLMKIGGAVAGLYAVTRAIDLMQESAKQFVNTAAQFEQFDATLQTIEGSSQKAQESMMWIQDFASVTPFNIDKVTSSFISLRSYGLDPTDGLLRTLGDTSAAMGKDIQQGVEAMADAVVGENERLKEYGIRASKIGNQIKYSWTNSSGEMRQAIIQNNSAIIESTLSAIFNSKYAGAMEKQSKTWNGLISNMQDNWTIFQKNLMDSGVFDYLKAIVTVVGESLSSAFGTTLESSATFSQYVIDGIKATISSFGYAYDSLETFGDYFKVIGLTAELAFEGIMVAVLGLGSGIVNTFENIIDGINRAFEWLINNAITSINSVLDIAASLGFGSGGNIANINLGKINVGGDFLKSYSDAANKVFLQTSKDLGVAWDNLMTTGSGQNFADKFLKKIDVAYAKIKNTPTIGTAKTDFGNAPTTQTLDKTAVKKLTDYKTVVDSTNVSTDNLQVTTDKVNQTVSDFNNTLANDTNKNDTYTVVNNVNDSFNNLNTTANKTTSAIQQVSKSLDVFIFKFQDTFLKSIESNIQTLSSIGASSSFNTLSYQDALANASSKRDALIANPLDVNIGSQYKDAYGTFIDSANSYLSDMGNFSSQQDYQFAQSTVGSQASIFEDTALQTVDVLQSMNTYLSTINQAFSDGILTDAEKATIAGVATTVNDKNEILLGSSSDVVAGIDGIPTSISSQTYYDNTGLATDATLTNGINTTEQSPISGFMKDATFTDNGLTDAQLTTQNLYTGGDINTTEQSPISGFMKDSTFTDNGLTDAQLTTQNLYTGGDINAKVNTITGFSKSTDMIGDNSVSSFIKKLMGDGTSGISLTSIASSLPDLSVSTGLDVSALSSISTNTASTSVNTNSTKDAVNNTSIKGSTAKTLDNLRLKSVTTSNSYAAAEPYWDGASYISGKTDYSTITGTRTDYTYYAQGGFTGLGVGRKDRTGFKQAGIVHEDEWVAPKWMIKENPALFGALELHRLGKKTQSTSISTSNGVGSESKSNQYLFVLADEIKQMNQLLRQVTDGGVAMKTEALV